MQFDDSGIEMGGNFATHLNKGTPNISAAIKALARGRLDLRMAKSRRWNQLWKVEVLRNDTGVFRAWCG